MTLTLEVIAQRAGVSRSTVSRVINKDKYVSDSTRTKVQEVINSLNFQPNIAARSLAAGRTGIIGLVIPAGVTTLFNDPYFPQLIQGISAASNAHDYTVMLWVVEPAYEVRTIRQILHSGLLDGVIVSSMLMDDPIILSLHESKMPFMLVGRHPTLDVNYVDIDNYKGAFEGTNYLVKCGCQRIATITGPKNMIAGFDRYRGYCEALGSSGVIVNENLVAIGDFTERGGYLAMKELLPHHPDGVFVASDTMAIGALRAIQEKGILVPEDISIIGFDDAPIAAISNPPLTTMRQSTYTLGYTAMETLMEVVREPKKQTRHVVINSKLVVRGSCRVEQDEKKEVFEKG